MSIFKDFVSFASKYAGELRVVSSVIDTIVGSTNLPRETKQQLSHILATLQGNAESVASWAKKAKEPVAVKINKKDIDAAVKEALPGVVGDLLDKMVSEKLTEKANAENQS